MKTLAAILLTIPCSAAAQPASAPFCMPNSQAQALASWLAQAQALQAQMVEASQAPQREAEMIRKARADQKAEDDAARAKPGG